jgi:hypothetical protein
MTQTTQSFGPPCGVAQKMELIHADNGSFVVKLAAGTKVHNLPPGDRMVLAGDKLTIFNGSASIFENRMFFHISLGTECVERTVPIGSVKQITTTLGGQVWPIVIDN